MSAAPVVPIAKAWGNAIRTSTDIQVTADQAEIALANDENVFQRGNALVQVVQDAKAPKGVERAAGAPIVRPLAIATLREKLSHHAAWERFDKRSEDWVPTLPPEPVVQALYSRGQWGSIRDLVAVTQTPVLRADGTVLDTPGYDAATGYLYVPNALYPAVPAHPTEADVLAARDALAEVVVDFPFAKPCHKSAWFALVLTLFGRPAINGCVPLLVVDSSTRGSGKGKAVDAAARIYTGRDATKTTAPEDDAEMRKRLTALLTEGELLAVIDNVVESLSYPALDAALTATVWRDRILGRSGTTITTNLMQVVATGVNVTLAADTARRAYQCRIEPKQENPEDRDDWQHPDLLDWVSGERPRLVRAALTILRGYVAAGRPDMGAKAWGSFESWSRLIPHACVWIGLDDPTKSRGDIEAGDTTKNLLVALLEGWERLFKDRAETARGAIALLYPPLRAGESRPADEHEALREAIESFATTAPGKPPNAARLGVKLRQFRRRIVGGRCFDTDENARGGIAKWKVVHAR